MTEKYNHYIKVFGPGLVQDCEKFHMKSDYIDFMWDGHLGRLFYDANQRKFSLYRAKTNLKNTEMICVFTSYEGELK